MAIKYNSLNVDEKYSGILEPNLYYNNVLVPGVTCTDKYETGPAGQIYVHKITTSAADRTNYLYRSTSLVRWV